MFTLLAKRIEPVEEPGVTPIRHEH
jgi:hypothetical protein